MNQSVKTLCYLLIFMGTFACLAQTSALSNITEQTAEQAVTLNSAEKRRAFTEAFLGVDLDTFVLELEKQTVVPADHTKRFNMMSYDVSVNNFSVAFGQAPPAPGTTPNGQPFIIEGYLYPAGTFAEQGNDSGINEDGSPQFPDLIIGRWICEGNRYPPSSYTTQHFFFADQQPDNQLISKGFEPFTAEPIIRPVIGGAGRYLMRQGQVAVQVTGFNSSTAPNYVITFQFGPTTLFKQ